MMFLLASSPIVAGFLVLKVFPWHFKGTELIVTNWEGGCNTICAKCRFFFQPSTVN
ncbi:unnamed protein product [Musa acuminata var. zebrina]